MEDSIARGFKVIEIDVALTADNVPVLSHRFCPCNKKQFEQIPVSTEFLATPINGRFTPMTLQVFFEEFQRFDGYTVIDPYFMYKGGALFDLPEYIEECVTPSQLGRIIYSVPSLEFMVALSKRGHRFASLHYALPSNLDDDNEFWRLPYFVRILTSCNVRSVSMGDREITGKTLAVVRAFRDVGIHVSVAGINDVEKCNKWMEAGVDIFNTDLLSPCDFRYACPLS